MTRIGSLLARSGVVGGAGRLSAAALLAACSSTSARPPYSPQPPAALARVDFGPPPGRVESIPPQPPGADAWVDGEWILRRGRWFWLLGRWVHTPPGATYSPWVVVRSSEGALFYAPSQWRDSRGTPIEPPAAIAFAAASGSAVFDPQGEIEPTGRNLETPPALGRRRQPAPAPSSP